MTDKERKASIAESASNYMRGRAMALSFKPLALGDVKDAFMCGAEEMDGMTVDLIDPALQDLAPLRKLNTDK